VKELGRINTIEHFDFELLLEGSDLDVVFEIVQIVVGFLYPQS
jgi:hypothetical protein